MRPTRPMFALTLSLLLAAPAWAGPPGGGGSPPAAPREGREGRREEIRERVQQKVKTYLTVELSSRLALDDKKALKLADALQVQMERRQAERQATRAEMKKLRDMVENKAGDAQLKTQIDAVIAHHTRGEDMQALLADTSKFLTVTEQAKLAIALPEVMMGLRDMMKDAKQNLRGEGRGGGRRGNRGDDDDGSAFP